MGLLSVSDHDLRPIITCNITVIRNVINKITDSHHGSIFCRWEVGGLVAGRGGSWEGW